MEKYGTEQKIQDESIKLAMAMWNSHGKHTFYRSSIFKFNLNVNLIFLNAVCNGLWSVF